jgi:hypothetical protein
LLLKETREEGEREREREKIKLTRNPNEYPQSAKPNAQPPLGTERKLRL